MISQRFSKIILVMAIVVLLTTLLAIVTTFPALAGNGNGGNGKGKGGDKEPVPHHNQVGKVVPASCNSRHARDAGQGCDEDNKSPEKSPKSTGTPRIVDEFGGTGQYAVTVMVTYYLGDPAMSNGAGGGSGARMLV